MDYELFKKVVTGRIREFLPPVYTGYTAEVRPVRKINEVKDSFCLFPPGRPKNVAIPTLYLDEIYEDFARDEDLERVLKNMACVIMTWSGYEVPEFGEFRVEEHTDSIVMNLINTEMNEELLEEVPHEDLGELSIIYRVIHSINENGVNSAVVTNKMLEGTGLDEKKLLEYGSENTPRIFPARVFQGETDKVYVVTNEIGYAGATTMLYEEDMRRMSERMEGDFYILPSSRHEFFAIGVDVMEPGELALMLAEGNRKVTEKVDFLSGYIFRYIAESGQLVSMVSCEGAAASGA